MFRNLSTDKKEFAYFIVIIFALAWFAMKLSLPVLPRLIHIFATTPAIIKLSVALFFTSYAVSQLFWGAASETYGRRPIILYGFLLACCGTIIVICSTDVWIYIIGRCLEGAGLGVSSPSARAMLADRFDRIEIAHILTICSAICGITPAVAPIIGGFIAVALGWRWVFIFFLILLILFFFLVS